MGLHGHRHRSDRSQLGARLWQATAFTAVQELFDQSGKVADHYDGDASDGLPGWHAVHSPVAGWGWSGAFPELLADWVAEHPLHRSWHPAVSPYSMQHSVPVRKYMTIAEAALAVLITAPPSNTELADLVAEAPADMGPDQPTVWLTYKADLRSVGR